MVKIHKAFHGIAVNDRSNMDVEKECSLSSGESPPGSPANSTAQKGATK